MLQKNLKLFNFVNLIKMGASIEGVGTTKIIVEGVSSLNSVNIEVIPDRIEQELLIAGALLGN